MTIYPAIDLRDGRCVRLKQGDFSARTLYETEPLSLALSYQKQGAEVLHIVDLDGAKDSKKRQTILLKKLIENTSLGVQCGGGVRSIEDVEALFECGAWRVVIGSLAVQQPELAATMLKKFGREKLVFAFDVQLHENSYYPCIQGWQQRSDRELFHTLEFWKEKGLKHLLCTDISRDGMLEGSNLALYQLIQQRYPEFLLQASGGVDSLADLQKLQESGIYAVIVGKALLDGYFSLDEAMMYLSEVSC